MKPSAEFSIYLAGIVPAGLFYEHIKNAVGSDSLFFALFVAYLLTLRLVAAGIKRFISNRR